MGGVGRSAEDAGGRARNATGQFAGLGGAGTEAGKGAETAAKGLEDASGSGQRASGVFGTLTGLASGAGGPIGQVGVNAEKTAGGLESMIGKVPGLAALAPLLSNPFTLAGVAVVAVTATLVEFGIKFQDATNEIAASEGISKSAAAGIGDAFASTAGQVTFGAQAITVAFAGSAAQLKLLNGGALDATQSLAVMRPAMDLAEASGTSLGNATTDMAKTLTAFGLKISDSPLVSNVLYNAAKDSGVSVDAFTASIDKAAGKMGDAAPPIGELGGLMVDLNSHALNSRTAMSALTTTISAVIKPSDDLFKAQQNLQAATAALPPSLQDLAANYKNMTPTQVTAATKDLTESQVGLWKTFVTSSGAVDTATTAVGKLGFSTVDANGKFIGMTALLGNLKEQIDKLPPGQRVAALAADGFGKSAETMYKTIEAGSGVLEKDTASVSKSDSAHKAAEISASSLSGTWKKFTSSMQDYADVAGQKALPVLEEIGKVLLTVVLDAVKGLVDSLKTMFKIFGDIADFIKDIFTGKWGDAWHAVTKIFEDFWNHLVELFHLLPSNVINALGDFAGKVGNFFLNAWNTVANDTHKAWSDIINFFTGIPHQILAALDSVVSDLHGLWSGIANWVNSTVIMPVVRFFTSIPGELHHVWSDLVNDITGMWATIAGWVNNNVIMPVVRFFTGIPGLIHHVWTDVVTDIQAVWTLISGWVNNNVIQPVVRFYEAIPGAIAHVWSDVVHGVESVWSTISTWVFDNVRQPVINFFEQIPGAIFHVWSDVSGAIQNAWGAVAEWVQVNVVDRIVNAFDSLESTAINVINHIISAYNAIPLLPNIGNISNPFTGPGQAGPAGPPGSTAHAMGGIFSTPHMALIAEDGPEAVLPLSNPNRMAEILGLTNTGGASQAMPMTTAGGASHGSSGATVYIAQGAFQVIVESGADATVAGAATAAVERGYSALTQELRSGVNPLRERVS